MSTPVSTTSVGQLVRGWPSSHELRLTWSDKLDAAMLLPPRNILRATSLPDHAMVVVRGGERSLDNAILDRTVGDCFSAYGFFGVSVFADPAMADLALLARRTPLQRRKMIRTATVGTLRMASFEVLATFSNPYHFSVVLPDATSSTYAQPRGCFSPPVPNPGYEQS